MHTAFRSRSALPILCLAFLACGKKAPAPNLADPNAPAIVQLPKFVPPGLATPAAAADQEKTGLHADDASRTIAVNYSVLGAAMVNGDARTVGTFFAPDAEMVTPDATYRGAEAIAKEFAGMGKAKSLRDFSRRSLRTEVSGTTVADSGEYVILTMRTGADSLLERGRYASTWRVNPAPQSWVMTKDRLYRDRGRKGR